ncbi:UDP-N-acetylglucosamine--undecaprenyl-phosphate N-acetylglucosaminephosphotransferase [Psychrobium sp. 1_MG-2023]|uniref:UDP-N-acetylglucosamine--undecaprenyl-phosphate N-acetylglucosaminephosphotransferase n=1 Tax=Psychrobium sp. 1_MG-2023 TaxID=3062624 RepID=UPI000C344FDB|nr:UDP-N-acetylglucosamine--undecaprenyl-phosphate N-acetylglucosaminephosphotransferase [Psychrobium sp. 1_MG-2023]MDP2562081.1 UDP-N-acetylglucosamine--undecaprenyl-phosphate N-acetylglucosaminephosphotransferase [Psychrobium sp. 1_MG-2023]PKF55731.1 undecaprenyl-phosphate alpha-N-acetylglucosaminyl 1-phosphate transferase [Alteromonadales bacterium alter-6D02]
MENIFPLICVFLITFFSIFFGKPVAIKLGLVDVPCERKKHFGSIPLVGGISIFIGVFLGMALFTSYIPNMNLYLIAAAFIVLIGVLDDFYDLPVKPRIAAQILVASIMIFGAELQLDNLGNAFGFGDVKLSGLGVFITIIAVLGAINAFNMVDGIDGLVGMLSIVTFSALAFLLNTTSSDWLLLPLFFIVSTLSFLVFNLQWPSSRYKKVFMGDAGSMLIGFSVVWLLVVGSQSETQAFRPVTALWLVAVPLMDMAAIMVRRVRKGQSPFNPDRDHLHHIFLRAGFSSSQTLIVISFISILFTVLGIGLETFSCPEWLSLLLFLLVFTVYSYAINHIWRLLKLFRKLVK